MLSSIKNAANTLAYATFGYDNNAAGKLSSITYKGCNKMKTKRIVKLMCKFVTTLLLAKSLALAGVNKINIQGTFFQNDGVTPITGQNHVVDVRLYTNATPTLGETTYFGEKHTGVNLNSDGKFNLLLGQGTLLPTVNIPLDNVSFDKQYFMEVTLDTVTVLGRQLLGSSGYSSGSLGNFVIGGKLGIGTINPLSTLHLVGRQTIDDSGNFELMANSTYNSNADRYLNNGCAGRLEFNAPVGSWYFQTSPNGTAGSLLSYYTKMTITNNGNVGIGTVNPAKNLEVVGEIRQSGRNLWLWGASANQNQAIMFSGWGVAHGGLYWRGDTKTFTLQTGDDADYVGNYGPVNLVVTGNVGLGTSYPQAKLDVNGDIKASGAIYAKANGQKYFQGGDDAALYDINIANTIGIFGAQDSTQGNIKLGSNGVTVTGVGGMMKVYDSNNVERIRIWGQNTFEVWGPVWANYFGSNSDARLKTDIRDIQSDATLTKLLRIKGKTYKWNKSECKKIKTEAGANSREDKEEDSQNSGNDSYYDTPQIGLIAQDVEKEFPEFVHENVNGFKGIDYSKLTVVLLEAVRAQQSKIDKLEARLSKLENMK